MSIEEQRHAIYHLLDESNPTDGMAAYFAFYHPETKTILRPYPMDARQASGYVALSRTGMDLFRPLVTLRLPITDMQTSANVIYEAIEPGTAVILNCPVQYLPLIQALFDIHTEEHLQLFVLDRHRFRPIINVLVTQDIAANDLPRFMVRNRDSREVVASATLNWQSPAYAEVAVNTKPEYRRRGWGRSVVAAMVNHLLADGRTPLYVVAQQNSASIQLAERVGFVDTGARNVMIQGVLKPRLIGQ
jgi:RimJ/RimL family protein N-acetyltransferase